MLKKRDAGGVTPGSLEGARSASGGEPGAAAEVQRWSARRKKEVVLRLLRGEPVDAVSRAVAVPIYKLEQWRDRALAGIDAGLKERDNDPVERPLETLQQSPESYRPPACPPCGLGGLWCHGGYQRKAARSSESSARWDPSPVPRFLCQGCGRTCACLPGCLAPRRWYDWPLQQWVLPLLLVGCSLHRCAGWVGLDRRTVGRWWGWLKDRGDPFAFLLRSRFPALGRTVDLASFWSAGLAHLGLMHGRAWLDGQEG